MKKAQKSSTEIRQDNRKKVQSSKMSGSNKTDSTKDSNQQKSPARKEQNGSSGACDNH
ncbi:MAG: hypothetical protein H7235_11175 [Bdellovibrionaceae bacterium]|nr:hypothetical protein [Pseudobdellovibrionaceae bacterium]